MNILMLLEDYDRKKSFWHRWFWDTASIRNLRKLLKREAANPHFLVNYLECLFKNPVNFGNHLTELTLNLIKQNFILYPYICFWQLQKLFQQGHLTSSNIGILKTSLINENGEQLAKNERFLIKLYTSLAVYQSTLTLWQRLKHKLFGEPSFITEIRNKLLLHDINVSYENLIMPMLINLKPKGKNNKNFLHSFWMDYLYPPVPPAYELRFHNALYYLNKSGVLKKNDYLSDDFFNLWRNASQPRVIQLIEAVERLANLQLIKPSIWSSIVKQAFPGVLLDCLELLKINKLDAENNIMYVCNRKFLSDFHNGMQILAQHNMLCSPYFDYLKNQISQPATLAKALVLLKQNHCLDKNQLSSVTEHPKFEELCETIADLSYKGYLTDNMWKCIKCYHEPKLLGEVLEKIPYSLWEKYNALITHSNFNLTKFNIVLYHLNDRVVTRDTHGFYDKILAYVTSNKNNQENLANITEFMSKNNILNYDNLEFILAPKHHWFLSEEANTILWNLPINIKFWEFFNNVKLQWDDVGSEGIISLANRFRNDLENRQPLTKWPVASHSSNIPKRLFQSKHRIFDRGLVSNSDLASSNSNNIVNIC